MFDVLIGTYTQHLPHVRGRAQGIMRLRAERGRLSHPSLAAPMDNPSWLAAHPYRDVVYAVSEVEPDGGIVTFINEHNALRPVFSDSTRGGSPAHAAVDPSGRFLAVATYGGGTVSIWKLDGEGVPQSRTDTVRHEGSGPDPLRQEAPHVHQVSFDPLTGDLVVVDLGVGDIRWYSLGPDGQATLRPEKTCVLGARGPRHLVFHPRGDYAFVCNELDSTVSILHRERSEPFTLLDSISTRAPGSEGTNYPAAIRMVDAGSTLLVSNRGDDTISVFAFDSATAELRLASFVGSGGRYPRDVVVSPDGNWVLAACQNSNLISVFAFNHEKRSLFPVSTATVPTPVSLLFV